MNFIFVSLIHNICKKCFIELRGLFSYEMFIFSIKVLRIYIINLFNICNLPLYIRLLSNPKIFDLKIISNKLIFAVILLKSMYVKDFYELSEDFNNANADKCMPMYHNISFTSNKSLNGI